MKNDYLFEQTFYNAFWKYCPLYVSQLVVSDNKTNCKGSKKTDLSEIVKKSFKRKKRTTKNQ